MATNTTTVTIVFEIEEGTDLHEDLCLAIHEADPDAWERLQGSVLDISQKDS